MFTNGSMLTLKKHLSAQGSAEAHIEIILNSMYLKTNICTFMNPCLLLAVLKKHQYFYTPNEE